MKKLLKFFISSKFILIFTFLINVAIFALLTYYAAGYIYGIASFAVTLFALLIISFSLDSMQYKLIWVLILFIMPVFGVALYFYLKTDRGSKRKRKAWQNINYLSSQYIQPDQAVLDNLKKYDLNAFKQTHYIINVTNMPVYDNSVTKYLASGEDFFKELFASLRRAEKYIFLEFFIIKEGKIWNELFSILKEKSRQGVEIKLLYDDFGCLDRFKDKKLFKKLENYKIEALPFNKIKPSINTFSNYRNHRKIAVIDGKEAFTGGVNIADEYANITSPYGLWKDSGIKVVGDAVWNFVVLFLNNWLFSCKKCEINYLDYTSNEALKLKSKEFIQPYGTGPLSKEPCGRNVYLNLINNAQKYIHVTTPYFIPDQETITALKLAAKSGVDVSIIVPGTPDKKLTYYLSRSYFSELIKVGIKIYEYTPGFIHSKLIIADGISCIVGTSNMDFRSLYLHFEDGVLIHSGDTVKTVNEDIEDIVNVSKLYTLKDMKKRPWYEKFISKIMRLFSPLF